MAKDWVADATAHAHGQFAAKAKRAGETTREYAKKEAGAPGKLGKEARLAETLMGFRHRGRAKNAKSRKTAAGKMYPTASEE